MNIRIDERSLPRLQRWGMMALALLLTLLPGVYFTVASHFSQQAESRRLETELLRQQEALLQAQCIQTEDHKNAVDAFFKKEKPEFKGR